MALAFSSPPWLRLAGLVFARLRRFVLIETQGPNEFVELQAAGFFSSRLSDLHHNELVRVLRLSSTQVRKSRDNHAGSS